MEKKEKEKKKKPRIDIIKKVKKKKKSMEQSQSNNNEMNDVNGLFSSSKAVLQKKKEPFIHSFIAFIRQKSRLRKDGKGVKR